MNLGQKSRPTTSTRLQLLLTLAITIVMAVSVLTFAPQAEASRDKTASSDSIGNGVELVGGRYYCDGQPAIPVNTRNVLGTQDDDVILAMGNRVELVNGRGGNDTICVMSPGAFIHGGPGNDEIYTPHETGRRDTITSTWGGPGNDFVHGGSGWDNISGGDGDDILHGGDGYDYLWGDSGSDYLDGGRNGSSAPEGVEKAGDLCIDNGGDGGSRPMRATCERGENDPFAAPSMPEVPADPPLDHDDCSPCSYSTFR